MGWSELQAATQKIIGARFQVQLSLVNRDRVSRSLHHCATIDGEDSVWVKLHIDRTTIPLVQAELRVRS